MGDCFDLYINGMVVALVVNNGKKSMCLEYYN